MSAKEQSTYIDLVAQIDELELESSKIVAKRGDIQAQIDVYNNKTIPGYQTAYDGWYNSNAKEKWDKIHYYSDRIQTSRAERDALIKQLVPLDFEIQAIKNEIKKLQSQLKAYVSNYDAAVIAGNSNAEAARLADLKQQEQDEATRLFFQRPSTWVVIALLVAAIIGGIIYFKRK